MRLEKIAVDYGTLDRPDDPAQNKLYNVFPFIEYEHEKTTPTGRLSIVISKTNWVVSSGGWNDATHNAATILIASDKEGNRLAGSRIYKALVDGAWDCDLPLQQRGYRIVRKINQEEMDEIERLSGMRKIPTK